MKHLLAAALLALAVATPAYAATVADGVGRLEGNWDATATGLDTPYSKVGSTTVKTTCAWSTGRDFLICQQTLSADGATSHAVGVYTYDAAAAKYHFYAAQTKGVADVGITVDATGIMYTNTFVDGTKNVTVRTLNVWDDPDHYHFWTEFTTDGQHWTKMLTGSSHRSQP
jgi:Protein of unknown function (DUF1579)